ncbi:GNAT family N-acetyltransferase [Clostridium gasigenes]|uniref:GNAT family N-acetyltransferase n=1 Tax=Clostridium gasigenes TaxID=94869 RepID=UPI00162A4674|nr:GNAT family N-acetyltransferase [Clostridium gasigenes]MBB6622836.1 GNAT family N-acetyltransferase [Clostridium gasigenes]MBU3089396.1 GNAT family N-acetyltransferase [Clostridium gasigenes]MBU3133026.1 GNAT family N-acetyltransferase [Clostridium gasigenes]MBU3137727.1 GNAT family N-acetyltransferase [Clostridium gasigenes]
MNKILKLKRKDGKIINVQLKNLDITYIDKIMEIQNIILEDLKDKRLYAATDKEEFIDYINIFGKIIGYITEEDELIAMGVYAKKGYAKGNYGYDIELEGEELLKVGQIESTVVREEYRGNRLQKIICETLEEIAREEGDSVICATASPYNEFSVNTFKKLGYEIKKDKIKYGGLRRYILVKKLEN